VQVFLWEVPLKEENIVNCVQRKNTNFDVKIKKFRRAHCKKWNFTLFLKVHLFLWLVPVEEEKMLSIVRR